MKRSRNASLVLLASVLAVSCTGHTVAAPKTPPPDLSKFLHANYTVVMQHAIKLDKTHPEAVVVVSSGPGLTPDAPVQGGTQDVQLLTYDPVAKRWNLALDAANKVVPAGFVARQGNDPAQTEAVALLPQDHLISDASAQVVTFQPGQTSLVIYGIDSYYNHPPGVLAIVNLVNGSPQVSYYDAESNLSGLKVTGKPGAQRLTISASFTAPGDAGCCPVRDYTQVIGSTDDGHSSPPSVGVIEDDRPWLGAYVTSDASEPDALAVVGTVDGTPASSLLHIGDRVIGVLGETLPSKQPNLTSPVFDLLALHKPGDSVTLVVKRVGKRLQLPVVLGSRQGQGFTLDGTKESSLDVEVGPTPLGSVPKAVVITSVVANGVGAKGGLSIGDRITKVGNTVIADPLDLAVALWGHSFEALTIAILRPDGTPASGPITPTQADLAATADPL
jgi:hypothetical protein